MNTFVADATVASREPVIYLDDGVNAFGRWPSNRVITASQTIVITHNIIKAAPFTGGSGGASEQSTPLPEIQLAAGWRIRTVTANLQAGDNYSAPQFTVEEWRDP
jgi:hypothetical protein